MRLHPRCHVVDAEGGLVLCRGRARLELVEPADAETARRVLAWLEAPSPSVPVEGRDLGPFLGMVGELESAGFLINGEVADRWSVPPELVPEVPGDLDGADIMVLGSGELAARVAATLEHGAARVTRTAGAVPDGPRPDLVVAAPDGPDLAFLDATSEQAATAGIAHLAAFPLGDEAVVGPYAVPGRTPCFRCWELRWLGLAESTTAEVRLHAHLRSGGWRRELGRPRPVLHYLADQAARVAAAGFRAVQARGEVYITEFVSGTVAAHPLQAHPACGRCAPAFSEPRVPSVAFRRPEDRPRVSGPLADLEPLVDARVGAAAPADVEPATTDGAAALAIAHARFAAPHPEDVRYDSEGWAHGAAATEDEARLVAVAEALERYCGVFTPRPAAVAAYASLDEEALWPPALPLYSARQYARPGFPFEPFEPRQAMPWAWGHNLVTGRSLLVPQDAVRYGPAPSRLVHVSSSGVAAHTSLEAALLGATLEVVERDALMIFWLNRLSPPLVDLTHHSHPFVAAARGDVHRMGYGLRLADLTTDLKIPVVLAIATREDLEGRALVLGAGASLDPIRAVTKALRELLGSLLSWQGVEWAAPERLETDEVRELADHARAYYHPSWLSRADFLWSSDARSTLPLAAGDDSPPADQLATCVSRLAGAGLELIAADLTTPDIGAHGLRVMRAIVPDAQPIGFGPTGLRLGGRRLYTAPAGMGFTSTDTSEESLNPDPHCFP